MIDFTPEKSKKIALARLDLIHKWLEFRKKSTNKLQADYDFVKLHNISNSNLFEILGKISRGSLHSWNTILNGTEDYTKLIPQLNQLIKYFQNLGVIDKSCEFQVKRITDKIKFDINRIVFN